MNVFVDEEKDYVEFTWQVHSPEQIMMVSGHGQHHIITPETFGEFLAQAWRKRQWVRIFSYAPDEKAECRHYLMTLKEPRWKELWRKHHRWVQIGATWEGWWLVEAVEEWDGDSWVAYGPYEDYEEAEEIGYRMSCLSYGIADMAAYSLGDGRPDEEFTMGSGRVMTAAQIVSFLTKGF